jgi:hypothetical protein
MDITKLTDKLKTFQTQLHNPITPTHLYGLGTAVFFASIFSFLIFIDSYPVLMFWLCEGMILVMVGFLWEAFLFIKKLYQKSFIASAIVSLSTGAITSTLAIVIAEQLINQATHLNPDYFDNSLRIITALSMPLVLVYLVAFCLMAYYLGNNTTTALNLHPHDLLKNAGFRSKPRNHKVRQQQHEISRKRNRSHVLKYTHHVHNGCLAKDI